MRRVLIVSPHFPPSNAPDHQRVRTSLPYFRQFGWEPVVLAVDARQVEAPLDPLLGADLPDHQQVERVNAWPAALTRRFGLGNVAYRAWFQLHSAGADLLRAGKFDLVYFSTTQFVATALGPKWRRRFGVPYVVDIQDPWRTDYYERPGAPRPPGGWKYRLARRQADRLEERAWRDAAGFISVSEDYLVQLRSRYPWFSAKPSATIPFGAAERDFRSASARDDVRPAFVREPGTLNLASVGAIGPIMQDSIRHLFAAVRELRATNPSLVNRLRFHFIGTSYATANQAAETVAPIAAQFGLADLVREKCERVGYFAALKTMLAADALLIPSSNDLAYNPSKIATCFLAAKPTLVLAPPNSATERAVQELAFAVISHVGDPLRPSAINSFLETLARDPDALVTGRNVTLFGQTHSAEARTRQQCELLDRALAAAATAAFP
jgi:glycosyltransferase involved in cell wall biosynthesis